MHMDIYWYSILLLQFVLYLYTRSNNKIQTSTLNLEYVSHSEHIGRQFFGQRDFSVDGEIVQSTVVTQVQVL